MRELARVMPNGSWLQQPTASVTGERTELGAERVDRPRPRRAP